MSYATVMQLAFSLLGVMPFHVFEDNLHFLFFFFFYEPSVDIVASNFVLEYLMYESHF